MYQVLLWYHSSSCGLDGSLTWPSVPSILTDTNASILQDYPYKAISDECQQSSCKVVPGTDVDKWIDVDHDSEEVGCVLTTLRSRTDSVDVSG